MKKFFTIIFEWLCCGASFFLLQILLADSPIILWVGNAALLICAILGSLDALWEGRFLDKFLLLFPEPIERTPKFFQKKNCRDGIPEFFVKAALTLSAAAFIVALLDPMKSGLIILAAIGIFFASFAKALLAFFND